MESRGSLLLAGHTVITSASRRNTLEHVMTIVMNSNTFIVTTNFTESEMYVRNVDLSYTITR